MEGARPCSPRRTWQECTLARRSPPACLQDGALVLVPPATRDAATRLADDGIRFLDSIDQLRAYAAEFLAAASKQVLRKGSGGRRLSFPRTAETGPEWKEYAAPFTLPWQGDYVDELKLKVAGLKCRLNQLGQDRKRLEQECARSAAAKEAELARLTG